MDRPASRASSRSGPARAGSSAVWRRCSPPSKARAGSARSGRTRSCWRGSGPRRCRRPSRTSTSRSGSSGSSCRSATRSPLVGCRRVPLYIGRPRVRRVLLVALRIGLAMGATQLVPLVWLTVFASSTINFTIAWTVSGATFDARQAKRLFPLLTSAAIAGSFLGTLVAGPVAGIVERRVARRRAGGPPRARGRTARPASTATSAGGAAGRSLRRWSPTCGSASTPCSGRR